LTSAHRHRPALDPPAYVDSAALVERMKLLQEELAAQINEQI
jgi:hypothetical protein